MSGGQKYVENRGARSSKGGRIPQIMSNRAGRCMKDARDKFVPVFNH